MTRLLVIGDGPQEARQWAERNARFTIGFDAVDVAGPMDLLLRRLDLDTRYEGIVMVTGSLSGPMSGRAQLYRALHRVLADDGTVVVAPARLPTVDVVVDPGARAGGQW